MVQLKDVYPLYVNNEARQPNTDLEVTDKFTGEVAFRVAQADAATILEGIEGCRRRCRHAYSPSAASLACPAGRP